MIDWLIDCSGSRSADVGYHQLAEDEALQELRQYRQVQYRSVWAVVGKSWFLSSHQLGRVTNTSLRTAGKWPSDSERLNSSTTNGAKTSMSCLSTPTSELGRPPRTCQSRRTASMSSVSGKKHCNCKAPGRTRLNDAGGARRCMVFNRIRWQLSQWKKNKKLSWCWQQARRV